MTTRAIGYVRLSVKNGENGAGLKAQERAIRARCRDRGWELLRVEADHGSTGANLRREGITAALRGLAGGEADALVVAKLDRLSRSVHDFTGIVRQATEEGWAVVVLDPDLDMTSPYGKAMASVIATMAELERDLISQRIKEALAVKKANGVKLGRPRGIPLHVRERIVRERVEGATLKEVAQRLNDEGVPTASGQGRWHVSTVVNALRQMEAR